MRSTLGPLIGIAILVVLVLAPLAIGIAGWVRMRREPRPRPVADHIAMASSLLL